MYYFKLAHCSLHRQATYTRPVQRVSVHFEYLENLSRGLDISWHPVRGDLTVHT